MYCRGGVSMPAVSEKVIADYLPVLKRIGNRGTENLIGGIQTMKEYGVESYSERLIYKNGYSSMFCTSLYWAEINKTSEFYKQFRNHVSPEIVKSFHNKSNLISRSADKTSTPFLKTLENHGVNNSIIIEEFHRDYIKITYFMGAPDDPAARDLMLNNIERLNFIRKRIEPQMKNIFCSKEFAAKKELILNDTARNIIWQKPINRNDNKVISTKYSDFTYREMQCLKYLKFASSNRYIANDLGISMATVKHHIANIKTKLNISSRQELIDVSNSPEIINASKIIGKI